MTKEGVADLLPFVRRRRKRKKGKFLLREKHFNYDVVRNWRSIDQLKTLMFD